MDPGHSRLAHMTVRIKMQGAVQWQVSDSQSYFRTCNYLYEPVPNPNTREMNSLSTAYGGKPSNLPVSRSLTKFPEVK